MPYSKDIRCGQGWFNFNLSWFYEYLSDMGEEIVVKADFCESEVKYHEKELEEHIEEYVNDYISWAVFKEKRNKLDENDSLPEEFDGDIYGYVYDKLSRFTITKHTWYEWKDI